MSLIYKHEARGREAPEGGVLINDLSDLFAEQREAWANVNWFLAK